MRRATDVVRLSIGARTAFSGTIRADTLRLQLVDQLRRRVRAQPSDQDAFDQLVRRQVELRDWGGVALTLNSCRAAAWWCGSLAGYAADAQMQHATADSIFQQLLAGAPESIRCAWADVTPLLRGAPAEQYASQQCSERTTFETHFWALSDPLLASPANERRGQHYARRVAQQLLFAEPTRDASTDSASIADMLIRFGVADHTAADGQHWHYVEPQYQFTPLIFRPDSSTTSGSLWQASTSADSIRERATVNGLRVLPADIQIGAFRSRVGLEIVARWDQSADTTFYRGSSGGFIAAIAGDSVSTFFSRTLSEEKRPYLILRTETPELPEAVGVESYGRFQNVAWARASTAGLLSGTRVIVTAPLLFTPSLDLPQYRDGVYQHMLTGNSIPENADLGMYWESYAPDGVQDLTFELQVTNLDPSRPGFLTRLLRSRRLSNISGTSLLRFGQSKRATEPAFYTSLVLQTANLEPGSYQIRLTATDGSGESATVVKDFRVLPVVAADQAGTGRGRGPY